MTSAHAHAKTSPAICPNTEDAALLLLKGLNFLLAQADRLDLHPAAAILNVAREDLAGWAADCAADRQTAQTIEPNGHYQQLLASGLFPAAEVVLRIGAITDAQVRQEIAQILGLTH